MDRWIWPEWSEADINSEKWDKSSGPKGKSTPGSYFEDPDGFPTLPKSLADKCTQWKRIPDLYAQNGGGTMIVESESAPLSLLQSNTHLFTSPYIRYIIGQLKSLQSFCHQTDDMIDWRPWHQIYSLNKAGGKGIGVDSFFVSKITVKLVSLSFFSNFC